MRLTDGQTDRQTEFSLLDRVSILCSAVKIFLALEGLNMYLCGAPTVDSHIGDGIGLSLTARLVLLANYGSSSSLRVPNVVWVERFSVFYV